MGTANPMVQAKNMRNIHCMMRLIWLDHASWIVWSVQNISPARKAPNKWEEPAYLQTGIMTKVLTNTSSRITFSCWLLAVFIMIF